MLKLPPPPCAVLLEYIPELGLGSGEVWRSCLGKKKQPVEREIKLGLSEPADFIPTKMETKPVNQCSLPI